MDTPNLDLTSLRAAYAAGETPASIIERVYARIESGPLNPVWISLVPREQAIARAQELAAQSGGGLPLYGVPFAIKDNMDVAGIATTAGCPAFSYIASETATVVQNLQNAGAILVGKTNMDQFATGLVGTRTPYGACASVFDARYISGGSSSGSAVAVARGLVSFALGTDTAGSGRVPAAFNNIVGLKPTRGMLSARGVVPACRSLDCVSVFALTSSDAWHVFQSAQGFDAGDPYSRHPSETPAPWLGGPFQFGVLRPDQREFFGDNDAARLYEQSISAMETMGGTAMEFDFQPFQEAAALLYAGPWVAERRAALGEFFTTNANDLHPVVRGIIAGSEHWTATDGFLAQYRLAELRRQTEHVWRDMDILLLPTTGTTYTIDAIARDPVRLNSHLGYYTNFANLLDLAAVAVPAGFRANRLPFGISLFGQAQTEQALLTIADRLHCLLCETLGGLSTRLADTTPLALPTAPPGCTLVAVVGAHLSGQPLNFQLTQRGARLAFAAKTANDYRLYALAGTVPPKPGLARAPGLGGPGIEVEVWAMPTHEFGSFVAAQPAPLGIGSVQLNTGMVVKGFICEPFAISSATEITHFGGWRAFLEAT